MKKLLVLFALSLLLAGCWPNPAPSPAQNAFNCMWTGQGDGCTRQ